MSGTDLRASIKLEGDAKGINAAAGSAAKSLEGVADKSDALAQHLEQSAQRSVAAMEAHAKATKSTGLAYEAASAAAEKAAAAQERAAQKAADAAEKAAARAAAAAEREAVAREKAAQRASGTLEREAKKAADAQERAAQKAAAAQERESQKAAAAAEQAALRAAAAAQREADARVKAAQAVTAAQEREAQKSAAAVAKASGKSRFEAQQLSYQLNDFFVQVASGQSPLTAMIQQGSQLTGTFGGIGGAVKAVTALITPAAVGMASLATVIGGVGYAYYAGSQQTSTFNRSLILTGNYAGLVGGQLDQLSAQVVKSTGTAVGGARETLQTLVSTGKVTRDALVPAGQAVETIAALSGRTREDVVKDFDGMGNGVAKFAAKINETYHFLSYAQYKHIQQLDEEGKGTQAQVLMLEALNGSFGKVSNSLGTAERGWQAIKNAASSAWDSFLGIGRETSLDDKLAQAQARVRALTTNIGASNGAATAGGQMPDAYGSAKVIMGAQSAAGLREAQADVASAQELVRMTRRAADSKAEYAQAQEVAIKADQKWQALADGSLSKQQRMNKELAEAARLATQTKQSPQALAKVEAGIREKYKGGPSADSVGKAQLQFDVTEIQRGLAVITDAYGNAEKIMQAARAAGLVDEKSYYASKVAFVQLGADAQIKALTDENARIAQEKANAKDKIDNDRTIAANKTKMAKINADAAAQVVVLGIQEKTAMKGVVASYVAARMAAQDYLDTTRRQQQRQLDAVGMSDRQRAYGDGRNQIDDKYLQQQTTLENERNLGLIKGTWHSEDQDKYVKQLALLKEFHEKASEDWDDYYAKLTKAEADWGAGASRAIGNYIAESANMAKQTESLFVKAFGGAEDALVQFVRTGKLDFESLADSIIADLIRIQAKAQLSSLLQGSGSAGGLAGLFGNTDMWAGSTSDIDLSWFTNMFHTGGIIGRESAGGKAVHPSVFGAAPRFHTGGITGDEVPIITKRGEGVFTQAQMRALAPVGSGGSGSNGPVSVTIINQTGNAAQATARRTDDGGIEVILTAVKESMAQDIAMGTGAVTGALTSRYNLRPSMA